MNSSLSSVLTASEARSSLYEMLDDVTTYLRRFVITHKGKPQAILIPIEDIESLEETLDIISDKALMKILKQAQNDRKVGKTMPLAQVKKMYVHER